MDPITAVATTLNLVLTFAGKVYDDTPAPLRQQGAADWARFIHNIADAILATQAKLNAAVKP
jgi:hypothetical protein